MNPIILNIVAFLRELFDAIISKFIVAILILLVGVVIGRIVDKLLNRALSEIELNAIIKKATKINVALEEIISHSIAYFIYFITIILSLRQLGIATGILNILSLGVIIVIVLSIFLSIKDFIPNSISGIILLYKGLINEGETIMLLDMVGKIDEIGLLETKIITKAGDVIYIPNSLLTKYKITIRGRIKKNALTKKSKISKKR